MNPIGIRSDKHRRHRPRSGLLNLSKMSIALPGMSGTKTQYGKMKSAVLGTGCDLYFDGAHPVTNVNTAKTHT